MNFQQNNLKGNGDPKRLSGIDLLKPFCKKKLGILLGTQAKKD